MKTRGQIIQDARKEARLTQVQLGALVGVGASAVSMIEAGKRAGSTEVLVRIALALDLTAGSVVAAPWKVEA
jgi:transcriptional regulator with XRE-family HTH domain